jgi:predicted RNase H-like nuclease (RuvC/YqgF family)
MFASSKKAKLNAEIERLEKELTDLSDNLSESQIRHKRVEIQRLKQELVDVDKNQFNSASDKLKQDMAQQDMMAAMAQGQGRS